MQVTLTRHAENLLRTALDRQPGQSPEAIIQQALAQRFGESAPAQTDPVWVRLKNISGLRVPEHWPPQFAQFDPLTIEGESVPEQLIRERR